MTTWTRYGRTVDHRIRPNLDKVWVANEDLGFNASLVTAVNDNFETTIPYPQEWDQDNEVMTMYKLWHALQDTQNYANDSGLAILLSLSMIDRSPAATFTGIGTDAEDEFLKAQFTPGFMYAGNWSYTPLAVGNVAGTSLRLHNLEGAEYVPVLPVPTVFPVFEDLVNNQITVSQGTMAETPATFSSFERYYQQYEYTVRRMTSRERSFIMGLPGVQQRWAQLGS